MARTAARDRRINRELVITTAIDLLDAEGLGGVTLAAVAGRLGCAAPSLYNHVGGLDDLLDAVQTACMIQLANAVRDAAIGRSGRDAVTAVGAAWREFAREFPPRYVAVFRRISAPNPDHDAAVALAERTAQIVESSMGIGDDQIPGASWVIRAYLQGFTQIEGAEVIPDADATFALGLDAVLRGLEARRDHQG